jgi:hypothetical protein
MSWRGFGFVHRSRTLFCRAVPNPNVTIRNFFIAARERDAPRAQLLLHVQAAHQRHRLEQDRVHGVVLVHVLRHLRVPQHALQQLRPPPPPSNSDVSLLPRVGWTVTKRANQTRSGFEWELTSPFSATFADFPRQGRSPYRGLHARRASLGFSRAAFCRPVPTLTFRFATVVSLLPEARFYSKEGNIISLLKAVGVWVRVSG